MAKIITLDEMLEIIRDSGWSEEYALFEARLITVGNQMARLIAQKLNVDAGDCTSEGLDLAGTAAAFGPLVEGDPMPEELAPYDTDSGWELRGRD